MANDNAAYASSGKDKVAAAMRIMCCRPLIVDVCDYPDVPDTRLAESTQR